MVDLKGVGESLKGCAIELRSIISNLKVEEETLKVIKDEFRKNIVQVEKALKTTQAEPS